jgi:nucleolar complex protein 3
LSDKLQEKSKHQTHILEHMFLIYFKILKTNSNLKLIPSVLEGLSKFAHLISLEFFDDLITVLHQMVEQDVCFDKRKGLI